MFINGLDRLMIKLFVIVYLYLILQMCFVWMLYRLLKNPSIVDMAWSIGLMISGLIYLWHENQTLRNEIIGTLLILWSLRLAGYLWITRIYSGHIDKRYTQLSNTWKINKSFGFFLNFQLQAIFIFFISINFYFTGKVQGNYLTTLDFIAIIIVIVGVIGESVADLQLQQFKASHAKEVCNAGLWRYSRHPNYFFDWVTWCGFALFALRDNYGYAGIISPILLYLIFTRITGPITEEGSRQSRGQAYIDYQAQTSMFFPWFKR